jgi:predicted acylesterase/phospholipase RssA
VVKALHDNLLLPRVLSGASVGAIVVAMIGTRTDKEIKTVFTDPNLKLEFFPEVDASINQSINEGIWAKVKRLFTVGEIADIKVLERCVRANVAELTFAEAYDLSGRIINIVVSPSTSNGNQESCRLLNYLTAPNVLVWSAVLASCAIPGLFQPVELLSKDDEGNVGVWIEGRVGVKWEDGSVRADLPMERLRELFNINHFIVSQVNPHVIPFLSSSLSRAVDPIGTLISRLIEFLTTSLKSTILNLIRSGLFPSPSVLRFMLDQTYVGDITLVPPVRFRDYTTLLTNPSTIQLHQCLHASARATFSHLAMIRGACEIEMALDEGVRRMRDIVAQEVNNQSTNQSTHRLNQSTNHFSRVRSWSTDFTAEREDREQHHTSDPFSARRINHSINQPIHQPINQLNQFKPRCLTRRHSESPAVVSFRPVEPRLMSTMDLARMVRDEDEDDDQSINQSIDQSIEYMAQQSDDHLFGYNHPSVRQPTNQSINPSLNSKLTSQSMHTSLDQSINHPINQSINQPISRLLSSVSFGGMSSRSSSASLGSSRMTRNLSLNELAGDFDSV